VVSALPIGALDRPTAAAVLAVIGEAVVATDPDGIVTYWNASAERLFGYSSSEAVGRPALEMAVSEPSPEQLEEILASLMSGRAWSGQFLCRRNDGAVFPVEVTDTPMFDDAGGLAGVVGVIRDVTDAQLHRGIVEAAQEGIVKVQDRVIMFSNSAAARILRVPAADLVGRQLTEFVDGDQLPVFDQIQARLFQGESVRAELPVRRSDGEQRYVTLSATALHDDAAQYNGTVMLFTDITERLALEQLITFRAMHDELTGLVNRAVLADRLKHGIAVRRRTGHPDLAVLFCDLDHFKDVNDSYGHDAGDVLLTMAAERIVSAVRPSDTVARFGGDEFVVVSEGVRGSDEAYVVAQRVQEALTAPFVVEGHSIVVTGSIGIAVMDQDSSSQQLLADADAAMYQAKRLGGAGRTCLFDDSLRRRATTRLQLLSDIRRGIDAAEFVCHYQPVVNLFTGTVVGVEALLRWQHPERGLLSPAAFLDVAEDSALILSLGDRALREACRDIAALGSGDRRLHVAVNVSARQFTDPKLAERIAATLSQSGLDPCQLVLEVTETTVMDDATTAFEVMAELRRHGVRLSIDDFGTGYSSLLYLRQFPIDELKIDRSFVGGLGTSSDDSAIVASIVSMSKALTISCVAEGVETVEQLATLRQFGCRHAQGYLFSRPVPASELLRTVSRIEQEAAHWERRKLSPRARPVAADTVRTVLTMHDAGASLHTIAAKLNADGERTPSGARWHARTVARVVADARNPLVTVEKNSAPTVT
jgi:diguanylate cyclase (GGDEF)-like protein/PAS domain S-box-containing protein